MTRIVLVRHGETEWNAARRVQGWTNSALSARGRRQAEAAAARLSQTPLAAVYASDLTRALDTAAPLAAAHGLPVEPRPALREKCYGEWEGRTVTEIAESYPELWHRYHVLRDLNVAVPSGETWPDVQARLLPVLDDVRRVHPGETVALVGHGGSLRVAVLHALGAPLAVLTRLRLDNASVTCLEYPADGEGRVAFLNDTSHLGAVGP